MSRPPLFFVVLGLLTWPGCPGGGGPGPQPTPTPPPPWECELEMPRCDLAEPPQQCSSPESPCWHNPTSNPEHCEQAPACDPGAPLPEPQCPQFMDRGGTVRPLSDECDCHFGNVWIPCEQEECIFPQGVPDEDFTERGTTSVLGNQVNAAMERLTACSAGTNCDAGPSADEFFDAVTAELRATGLCAGRHDDTPPGASDEIAVATECTGTWESYHIYNYGGSKVVWSPNAARPAYTIDPSHCVSSPGPQPTPTPPPPGECPQPHPNVAKTQFKSAEKVSHLDTTWITVGQPDFCASIGYCCMPGTGVNNECGSPGCIPRGGCPVRGDGSPLRPVCEAELCDQKWECNGEPVDGWRGNSAQTDCRGHWKTYCANAPTVAEGDR